MNCLPPTRRFFIGTWHQVHRRSGKSMESGSGDAVMRAILSEPCKPCQPKVWWRSGRGKKSFAGALQRKVFVV